MSKSNEVCVPAIKLTKKRLLEERDIIDEKIKALDIVLEYFDDPEEVPEEKIIRYKNVLSEEEKKARKKEYMKKYFDNRKKKELASITVEKGTDLPAKKKSKIDYDDMG